jgi:hypothetical protein
MKRRWGLIALAAAVLLVVLGVVGAGAFVLGGIQSAKAMKVTRATPHQLAEAMKDDRFYSDYGKSALLVTGTVASVARTSGHLVVALRTDSAYGASCELGVSAVAPRLGEMFTVLTVGQAAERLPADVLLRGCVVP